MISLFLESSMWNGTVLLPLAGIGYFLLPSCVCVCVSQIELKSDYKLHNIKMHHRELRSSGVFPSRIINIVKHLGSIFSLSLASFSCLGRTSFALLYYSKVVFCFWGRVWFSVTSFTGNAEMTQPVSWRDVKPLQEGPPRLAQRGAHYRCSGCRSPKPASYILCSGELLHALSNKKSLCI